VVLNTSPKEMHGDESTNQLMTIIIIIITVVPNERFIELAKR